MAWQYFNDTGIVGGTANMVDQTFYIDSYKGSDLNVGSNAAPFQTIQKALDSASQGTGATRGADFILAGYFKEGDFSGGREAVSLIAEGDVVIDGDGYGLFQMAGAATSNRNTSVNYNRFNTRARRKYGRLTIKNFSNGVVLGFGANGSSYGSSVFDCTFENCARVFAENLYEGIGVGSCYVTEVGGCVFKDIQTLANIMNYSSGVWYTKCQNNTFLECNVIRFDSGADYISILSCYFDSQVTEGGIYIDPPLLDSHGAFSNCHIKGDYANHIYIDGTPYNTSELAQAANAKFNENGRLSTDASEFNALTPNDMTYPYTAVNATAGFGGTYIGAFGVANGAQAIANANWVASAQVDKTSVPTEAILVGTPTGTMTTTAGIKVVNGSKAKKLTRILLPDELVDYSTGRVIDTTKSADTASGSPSIRSVEIDFSADDGATYHGSWVEVPINGEPKIDGAGVGNGSDAYNPATGAVILLTHIKYKVTLRDDEVAIP